MTTTFELRLRRLPDGTTHADIQLRGANSAAPAQLASAVPIALDSAALRSLHSAPEAYGQLLSAQLFAEPVLREAWLKARAYAASGVLQLRLRLDASADALQALRWELLRDPESDQPIALDERVRLVRDLASADLAPVTIPPRPDLRALVVVASPHGLADYGLTEFDADGEVARARAALGAIPTTILADHPEAAGRATLTDIAAQLRAAPPIVILIAHGQLADGLPRILLERADGAVDPLPGAELVATIARLASRPLLLILGACYSAGSDNSLPTLGPALARAGVPAVIGFQGDLALSTVRTFLPALISELRRDGQIDRALAAARAALGAQRPWWQAMLWLRTDGRLWADEERPATSVGGVSIAGNVGTMQVINVSGGSVGSIIGSQATYGAAPASGLPPAPSADPSAGLRLRLESHRETLTTYLHQLAIAGAANVRPEVMSGIRTARHEIARIKADLRALGVPAADHPDDEG
jgi:CHAT domain